MIENCLEVRINSLYKCVVSCAVDKETVIAIILDDLGKWQTSVLNRSAWSSIS